MSQTPPLQPLLHDSLVVLQAPAQVWSAPSGELGDRPIHGVYVSDVRVLDRLSITVAGRPLEHLLTTAPTASRAVIGSLARTLDGAGADPDVRVELEVEVSPGGVAYRLRIDSRLRHPVPAAVTVRLRPDAASMDALKSGHAPAVRPQAALDADGARWSGDGAHARLAAPAAAIAQHDGELECRWDVVIPARGAIAVGWSVAAEVAEAVVAPASAPPAWRPPVLAHADDRLRRWVVRALDDLAALRLQLPSRPGDTFLAAGAPWFFTLFGRDSLWAARFLLPIDLETARGTLRVLAALQGRGADPATAEQPGKIMHELRRAELSIPGEGITLPPLYFGTVDATALWICVLHDAWRAGLPDADVRELLPALEAALAWMRDDGDSDGDGLLEYVDESGRGLSNQGWKDSGDSVQWNDGRLADGPIALCEVQAYAYEAAMGGAELLEAFGRDGAEWRAWAGRLRAAFRERFWVDGPAGRYPAIALDASKRPVDSLTSNIGHLLGTGLLSADEEALVAAQLVSPLLSSGFGLRTLATDAAGYWPLSYHGGSVWAHDTAIAISGLARSGFAAEAAQLADGLLAAAAAFDYRMPELHSGDAASVTPAPAPYPAACRPQAWSAAAAIVVLQALA